MEKYLYWSFHSGEIYEVLEDEVEVLDAFQLPLVKRPNPNCKKCYGRFYIGRSTKTGLFLPCPKCKKKCVDYDKLSPGIDEGNVIPLKSY